MKTLFRAFIFPPKHQWIAFHFGHRRVGQHARSDFSAALPIVKNRLPQKLDQ